ncbi:Mu transposase domain-containing protein [Pseudarthrobacter sp. DSP2-3-2b1]|uniref:Mu transposase domain-containing protein n=1 Tax=Pseudarthrobacter sp. DSP2-3-2b1 TaxID=2804661 RepID=UPI003CE8BD73
MLALPPVTGFTARVRLPRDYYVRMGSNDYSAHPQDIGQFVDARQYVSLCSKSKKCRR